MTDDSETFGLVLDQLQALEQDPDSAQMVRAALETLRTTGTAITFDAVLDHLWRYQELSGASMFAALIVRENNRQRVAAVLSAVPAGTAH